jgi:hypothetical protein
MGWVAGMGDVGREGSTSLFQDPLLPHARHVFDHLVGTQMIIA